jgi:hypothetical protein
LPLPIIQCQRQPGMQLPRLGLWDCRLRLTQQLHTLCGTLCLRLGLGLGLQFRLRLQLWLRLRLGLELGLELRLGLQLGLRFNVGSRWIGARRGGASYLLPRAGLSPAPALVSILNFMTRTGVP